jgi:hypothetical protein
LAGNKGFIKKGDEILVSYPEFGTEYQPKDQCLVGGGESAASRSIQTISTILLATLASTVLRILEK